MLFLKPSSSEPKVGPSPLGESKNLMKVTAGLAVFTILKAGFVFSGKAGSGLVIARLPDGSWSAPSCIATAGVGWGLQIGAGESSSLFHWLCGLCDLQI